MNTEDGKPIKDHDLLDKLSTIGNFLEDLQDRYELNNFPPADIVLSKNGDILFAKTMDGIILNRWKLDEFKDSKIY